MEKAKLDNQDFYGFIYITTNLVNGRQYIGQRKHGKGDRYYLGSGVALKNAIKKYGRNNFRREILEECSSREALDLAEIKWIAHYNAVQDEHFYNIAEGGNSQGNGNHFPERASEEAKRHANMLRSQKMSGENNPFFGHKHSAETLAVLSEKGKKRVGNKNGFYGHHHSEAVRIATAERNKARAAAGRTPFKGCHHTPETLKLLAQKLRELAQRDGYVNPASVKTIIQNQHTGEVFEFVNRKECYEFLRQNGFNLNNKGKPVVLNTFKRYFAHKIPFCNNMFVVIQ